MNNKLTEGKLHDSANSEAYSYDSAYRLVKFVRPNAGAIAPLQSNWTLDGVGNWKQVDAETRKHSSINEITSRTTGSTTTNIKSDDNGNEVDDGTFLYSYDFQNRLRTVTRNSDSALIAVYSYDADGRRIQKVVTNSGGLNGTTTFYLDGWQEIEEHDVSGAPTQQYVYGAYIDEPLVVDTNLGTTPKRFFYHQNTLHSVFALTDTTGKIVEGYQYDAYGRQTTFQAPGQVGVVNFTDLTTITAGGASKFGNPFMFTGRRLDPELTRTDPQTRQMTGLYYYRARYMDTVQGRFLQRDPLAPITNETSDYPYVVDNPSNSLDPYGFIETSEGSIQMETMTRRAFALGLKQIFRLKLKEDEYLYELTAWEIKDVVEKNEEGKDICKCFIAIRTYAFTTDKAGLNFMVTEKALKLTSISAVESFIKNLPNELKQIKGGAKVEFAAARLRQVVAKPTGKCAELTIKGAKEELRYEFWKKAAEADIAILNDPGKSAKLSDEEKQHVQSDVITFIMLDFLISGLRESKK
jgi:RHS repeat-associated protein